ncbi:MAG TPA: hypothetical protein VF411_15410 [Bacteroidia bacterium]
MIQQLVNPNIPISQRLRIVKNILALSLMASICFTFNWWLPAAYYPKIALYDINFNEVVHFILLAVLFISLLFMFLFRSPKYFISLSTICLLFAVFSDTAKGQYWLFFYLAILLLLCGHNWRIDTPRRYSAVFTAVKFLICLIYVLSGVQFLKTSINGDAWLAFIAPLEKICTPEQHHYLMGIRYVVPFIELFIVVGLFVPRMKMAAISMAISMHLFSFYLLAAETPFANATVLIWNVCMIFLLYFLFAGKTTEQKIYNFSFNLYGLLILSLALIGGLVEQDFFPQNKIDLMQSNHTQQFIYMKQTKKNHLPLYLQHFTSTDMGNAYSKLSVTNWCAHETKTTTLLSNKQLLIVCGALKTYCGNDANLLLSLEETKNNAIAYTN